MHTEISTDIRRTIGNLSSSYFVRFSRYPFLIVYVLIIPRMLGASDYGKLAFIISIVMLSSEIMTLGNTPVIGRFLPEYLIKKETEKLDQLLSGYFISEIILILIISIAGILLFFFFQPVESELFYIIVFLSVATEIFSSLFFSILYGLNYVGKSSSKNFYRTFFRLIFILILYPVYGFNGALFALLITPVLSGIYAVYFVKKVLRFKIRRPVIKEFMPKLKFGLIIFIPNLLFLFQQQVGPIFLKSFAFGNKDIGYFDLANQGFLLLYGIAATGFRALIPISSKFQVTGMGEKSYKWLFILLRYILPVLFLIIACFYLFGHEAISLVLGKEYISIYPITLTILFSVPVWIIGQLGYVRSVTLLKARSYFLARIYSTIIFIIFSLLLVKSLGALGLAYALFLGGITFSVSMLLFFREMILRILNIFMKILLAFAVFIPTFYLNFQNIDIKFLTFLISIILFLFALLKFKIINTGEFKQLIVVARNRS